MSLEFLDSLWNNVKIDLSLKLRVGGEDKHYAKI